MSRHAALHRSGAAGSDRSDRLVAAWRKNDPDRRKVKRKGHSAWILKATCVTVESVDDSLDAEFGASLRPKNYRRISPMQFHVAK